MSTLDRPIWSRCSIALTCPARSHFQRTLSKKDEVRVGINVNAHQEKEKNKETKTSKRRAEKERKRKQVTDFEEAMCCPCAVVQGAA